jgi:hypothetical protein
VIMSVFAVVGIGASALGIAWAIAEATGRWSAEPAIRAIAGTALGAAGGGLALAYAKSRKAGEPRETDQHGM